MKRTPLTLLLLVLAAPVALAWGFEAHRQINRHAVFALPPGMFAFYKHHHRLITENAVNPDKRRYAIAEEAARHYIDLERYAHQQPLATIPRHWHQARTTYAEDILTEHGILPWYIHQMKHRLTRAMQQKDVVQILRLSADIGHYIADANVPLHTTENYDGQLTSQQGIHSLWETRLPELFFADYDLLTGQATYISNPQQRIWEAITTAHQAVESILHHERRLSQTFPSLQKYCLEQQGTTLKRVHSAAYAQAYHEMLGGQVEQQMRASIKMVADFWLTCWVDAGQPDLEALLTQPCPQERLREEHPEQNLHKKRCCGE